MSLIGISLLAMLGVTFLNVMLGAEFSEYTMPTSYGAPVGIDAISGGFAIVIGLVGIALLIGVRIFGSGLADPTNQNIMIIISFGSLWGVLSALSMNLIGSIEIFGQIIWWILTIAYAIGVIEKIGGKAT